MSVDTDRATTRRIIPAVRERSNPSMKLASLSQRFFSKGEEQEANGYEGVILDDELTPPDAEFDSFDRIPRRRRPLLAITALLVSLPVIGYVTWRSTGGFGLTGSSVSHAAQAMVNGQPGPGGEPAASTPSGAQPGGPGGPANPEPAQPVIMAGTCQPGASGTAAAAAAAPAVPAKAAVVEPTPEVAPALAEAPAPARAAQADVKSAAAPEAASQSETTAAAKSETRRNPRPAAVTEAEEDSPSSKPARKSRSGSALRGYVWSPEANALVPAGEPATPPAPSAANRGRFGSDEPGALPADRPRAAPAPRPAAAAPPADPGAVPTDEPRVAPAPRPTAPTDPGALPKDEPRVAPAPRIAPPQTGALPAEKAPIIDL